MLSVRVLIAMFAVLSFVEPSSAKETLVVLNKEGASAWLINPATGEARAKIQVGNGPHEAAVSPDGRTAVVANYGGGSDGRTLTVIDVDAGKATRTIDISPHRRPHGINYHPDGKRVFVSSESDDTVIEVDVASGEVLHAHAAGGDVHMVALDAEAGVVFATAIGRGRLSEIQIAGGSQPRTLATGGGTEALAIRPGSSEVWVGNNRTQELKVVDREEWEVIDQLECGLQPIRLTFTPDGKYALVSCLLSGDLAVVDAASREVVRRIPLGDFVIEESDWKKMSESELRALLPRVRDDGARPIGVLVGPDGKFAYVANRGQKNIAVIDVTSWEIVRRLPTGPGPDGMAFSRIASGS